MRVEIRDPECKLVDTREATPVCGVDFCDRCSDCLHCYAGEACKTCRWVLYADMDADRIAKL